MGTTTNAYISFGIELEEGFEFPWEGDIDDWWITEVHGYKPPFRLYTDEGNYLDEHLDSSWKFNPEYQHLIDSYYEHKRVFTKTLPKVPVELVDTCSCDYPMYIIAIPSTVTFATRGCPQKLNVDEDFKIDQDDLKAYTDFIKKYIPELDEEPSWFLSSYWG